MTIVRALGACLAAGALAVAPLSSQSQRSRERSGPAGRAILLGAPPADAATRRQEPEEWLLQSGRWARDPEYGALYRTDRLLVRFDDEASTARRLHALDLAGADRKVGELWDGWVTAAIDAGLPALQARARLRADPAVADVLLDYRVKPFATRPNDEFFARQWNFELLDLTRTWDINNGANNQIVVAVVDTGMNVEGGTFTYNIVLVGRVAFPFAAAADLVETGRIVAPRDFIYGDELPLDSDGHGTHVAGTIAQLTNNTLGVSGIAHQVKLMPVKVLPSNIDFLVPGLELGGNSAVAEGIRYAADNGAHVINLSLGGSAPSPLERDAIRYAVSRGAFVTIAAGNDGDQGNPVEYPAAYGSEIEGAMTVGAVGPDARHAPYSGFKPYVEICAPGGGDGWSSESDFDNGVSQVTYRNVDAWGFFAPSDALQLLRFGARPRFDRFAVTAYVGTSMAAPHVAGVAALLYSQGLRNPAAVERAIKRFARPIDARADECGAGLVDPRGALRGLGLLQ